MTREGPGLADIAAVWVILGLDAVAIFVTYSRLPPYELYHVSESGTAAGAGRVLVFLNFPVMFAAIGTVAIVRDRLPGRAPAALGLLAVALCASTGFPGVVDQNDLDAKAVNAVPAVGVGIALALLATAARRGGLGRCTRQGLDRVSVSIGAALVLLSSEWIAAELGFFVPGPLFNTGARSAPFGHTKLEPAVHHGHHHGLDGLLLVLIALALSRSLDAMRPSRRRTLLAGYVALLFVYGLANLFQDFWNEQLHKRGWVSWSPPNLLHPAAGPAWAAILIAAVIAYVALARRLGGARVLRTAAAGGVLAAAVGALGAVGGVASDNRLASARAAPVAFAMADKGFDVFALSRPPSEPTNLTDANGNDLAPAWSPDGRRLAFASTRDGDPHVFVAERDGGRLRDVTAGGEPAWSPDGRRLAFARPEGAGSDVWVVDADGGRARRLAAGEWPAWSPDGRRIAVDRGGEVYVASPDGGRPVPLTRGRLPAWSPDGRALAFTSDRGGSDDVYVLTLRTSAVRRLTSDAADDWAPAWSPDGRRLLFVSDRDGRDQLFTIGSDGGGLTQLTEDDEDKDRPAWSG